jgi:hypothetical protein
MLSAVCALLTTAAALGQDVPFAEPPLNQPGQPDTSNLVSLGDIMQVTQMRHIKLWYAGKSKNWELVNYEINRISESLRRAVILYSNIPIETVMAARDPLLGLRDAAATGNYEKFLKSYSDLTTACNSCHTAGGVGFIRIQTPTSLPFTDELYDK